MIHDLLNQRFLGNRVLDYALFLAVLAAGVIAVGVLRRIVLHRLKALADRTDTTLDDFAVDVVRRMVVPLAYYGVFYAAAGMLTLGPFLAKAIHIVGVTLLTIVAVQFAIAVLHYGIRTYMEKQEPDVLRDRAIGGFTTLLKVVAWSLGAVFLLDNLGFKVSTVIAGLGIGGVAVALAAQAILGDLFSYFTIMFDRPFAIGDFIIVDDYMGVVEHLGIKSTRINSLSGEQIVMSNKDLTDSRVRNYKRMERRRVVFRLGVTYQTPLERLKEIPGIIAGIVGDVEDAAFDRAHFFSYGDFSLVFEVVYYVVGNDYTKYMDIQERINCRIHEEFAARKIEFAYPTQTLFLARA